jgi:prolyl-tRNA synthetase
MEKEFNINKFNNFSEWYLKVLEKAEIADDRYPLKGSYVYLWYGLKLIKNCINILEKLLEREGHLEERYPALIPFSVFMKEKDFFEGFQGEAYIVTKTLRKELKERLILRPTSETAMYYMWNLWIRSYTQLPKKIYQTVNIFRCETKMTKPLLRLREVMFFNEAHTAHATKEDAENQIKNAIDIYKEFFDSLYIPYIIVKTPEWDTFSGALYNYDFLTLAPDNKSIEIGSVINLGQKFAKAFDIKFQDRDEEWKYVWETCYGVAERVVGALISIHGDSKGLRLPFEMAPIQIIIIPILKKDKEGEILSYCENIKNKLSKFRVEIDKSEKTPGEKFNIWELKGVPIRIEIGLNEVRNEEITISRRDKRERLKLKISELDKLEEIGKEITKNLKEEAESWFNEKIKYASNLEELKNNIKEGFVKIPFCSIDEDGKSCAEALEEICDIAGTLYPEEEKPKSERCIVCGKDAKVYVYACRSY